jgi:guanylate kinase
LISKDAFLEFANFSGNWYGTTWNAINKTKEAGKICILDVDLAGVKSIKDHIKLAVEKAEAETDSGDVRNAVPQARFIFVRPPCKVNLEARLRGRGSETEESLNRRLARVDSDFEYADKPGNYDLNLVNDEFDSAYAQLVQFIFDIKDDESAQN